MADAEPDDVLAFLERLGHHPAADHDTDRPRAPSGHRRHRGLGPSPASLQEVAAAVAGRAVAGRPGPRRNAESRRRSAAGATTAETLHRLHAAVRAARPVSLRLVAADGEPTERRISPLDLSGGQLRGVDLSTAQVITIPLSRVLFASAEGSDD